VGISSTLYSLIDPHSASKNR